MTFKLTQNNVGAKIENSLDSTDTLVIMGENKETLLGSDFSGDVSKEMRATLVKFENGVVVQREIVNITAKSGKNFTITRAFEACPLNDSATVQSQVAYDFASGDYIYFNLTAGHINELGTRLKVVEDDKLDKADFDALSEPFQASNEGNDDYQIDDPDTTSYVNGKPYRVQADVNNDGVATLEINSLGAKSLKKTSAGSFNNLETGDIIADQIFTATYIANQDCFQYQQDLATAVIPPASSTIEKEYTYGETIPANRSLSKGRGAYVDPTNVISSNETANTFAYLRYNTSSQYYDQGHSFLLGSGEKLMRLTLSLYKSSSPTQEIQAKIYSDAAFTTLVETSQNVKAASELTTSSAGEEVDFDFTGLAENGTFYVKLEYKDSTYTHTSSHVRIRQNNSSVYADGNAYWLDSAGAAASQSTLDWWFKINGHATQDETKVFLTDPRQAESLKRVVGISKTSGVADDVKSISAGGIGSGLSGLSAWKSYYPNIPLSAEVDVDVVQNVSSTGIRTCYDNDEKGHGNTFQLAPGDVYNLKNIKLKVYNSHTSNTYEYVVRVYKDGVKVAESEPYDSTPLGTDAAGTEVDFAFNNVQLSGSGHSFVLEREDGSHNTSYYLWMRYTTTNVYGGGYMVKNNADVIQTHSASYDVWFEIEASVQNRYAEGTPVSSDISQLTDNNQQYAGYNATYEGLGGKIANPSDGLFEVEDITLKLYRVNSPTYDWVVRLYDADTDELMYTSDAEDLSAITTSSTGELKTFTFSEEVRMPGDFYYLLERLDGSSNTSHYIRMRMDTGGVGYGEGMYRKDSSDIIYLYNATYDPYFDITGNEIEKIVTLGLLDLEHDGAVGAVRIGKAISATEIWLADFSEEAAVGDVKTAASVPVYFYCPGGASYEFTVNHNMGSVPTKLKADFSYYINTSSCPVSMGSWDGTDQSWTDAGYTNNSYGSGHIGRIDDAGSGSTGYYIDLVSVDENKATFKCTEIGSAASQSIYGSLLFMK